MSQKTVYLAGKDIAYAKEESWRSYSFQFCLKQGLQIVNPLALAKSKLNTGSRAYYADSRSRHEVEEVFNAIDRSDLLLANLHEADESAWVPLIYARNKGKPTVVWGAFPLSPWLASYVNASFNDLQEALEYLVLVSQDEDKSAVDWSLQFESGLRENSERFPYEGQVDFQYFSGEASSPYLLLAPHATSYWSFGSLKPAESFTGAVAAACSRLTGAHALVPSYCRAEDTIYNYASLKHIHDPLLETIFRQKKIHGLELLVLVRGSTWDEPRGISASMLAGLEDNSRLQGVLSRLKEEGERRQIAVRTLELEGDQEGLGVLAEALQIPILTLSVHKSLLVPSMQRAHYFNLISLLDTVFS